MYLESLRGGYAFVRKDFVHAKDENIGEIAKQNKDPFARRVAGAENMSKDWKNPSTFSIFSFNYFN